MKKPDTAPLGDRFEPPAKRAVAGRTWEQPARQRTVVQPCTADEDGQASAALNRAYDGCGVTGVPRRCVLLDWLNDVHEMVLDAALLAGRNLLRADVKPAVYGGRIAADDLPVVALCERQRERALSGGRGSEDCDQTVDRYHCQRGGCSL